MKTKLFATVMMILLTSSFCFSQPEGSGTIPPPGLTIQERLKMVDEKICQPLNLNKAQTKKVDTAFNEFFVEVEKLMGDKSGPPVMPEKSKLDALDKIRNDKVNKIIPEELFPKFLELEMAARPKRPHENGNRPQ